MKLLILTPHIKSSHTWFTVSVYPRLIVRPIKAPLVNIYITLRVTELIPFPAASGGRSHQTDTQQQSLGFCWHLRLISWLTLDQTLCFHFQSDVSVKVDFITRDESNVLLSPNSQPCQRTCFTRLLRAGRKVKMNYDVRWSVFSLAHAIVVTASHWFQCTT